MKIIKKIFFNIVFMSLFATALLSIILLLAGYRFSVAYGLSMYPTFYNKKSFMIEKLVYNVGDLKRGDTVSLYKKSKAEISEETEERQIHKRIIGLPGEKVDIKENKVYINDELLNEEYAYYEPNTDLYSNYEWHWVLGPNEFIVLGDNRFNSLDSRNIGPVPMDRIESKSIFIIYSENNDGSVKYFYDVHQAEN